VTTTKATGRSRSTALMNRGLGLENSLPLALRDGGEDGLDDVVDLDPFGLGVEGRDDAVAQDGDREGGDVVDGDVETAADLIRLGLDNVHVKAGDGTRAGPSTRRSTPSS
jgi:hypothetical protein